MTWTTNGRKSEPERAHDFFDSIACLSKRFLIPSPLDLAIGLLGLSGRQRMIR